MIYVLALLGAAALVGTVYVVLEQQRILDDQARTIARQRALIADMQEYQRDTVAEVARLNEIANRQYSHVMLLHRIAPFACARPATPQEWLN
jgi:hypothetical protein